MIRILLDKAFDTERHYIHAVGLSTDTKPTTGIITGSKFVAVDTGACYLFDETAGEWNENTQLSEAVAAYLDEHPEALDEAAIEAIFDERLDGIEEDIGGLKSAVADLEAGSLSALGATNGQVPTADGLGSWEWATPSGGGGDVTDVQVNGVSVVQDGVANVPVASAGKAGAFYTNDNGFHLGSGTQVQLNRPTDSAYQAGRDDVRITRISQQHLSTFYGLAKAAGSDEKNSTLPVGQYTDSAKSAIQTMLGISGIIAPVEDATASNAYAIGDAFLHGGALYKASAAIAAGDAIVPGTNCTQTTIIEMLKGA